MILTEFAIYVDQDVEKAVRDRVFGTSEVIGHAYRQALGRYVTRGTWKVMVQFSSDPERRRPRLIAPDDPVVGVCMLNTYDDLMQTALVSEDDLESRLSCLEVLHQAVLEIADHTGWDQQPLEQAYAKVRANPRFTVAGPWKHDRSRTHRARVVFEEFWDGTTFQLEVESEGRIRKTAPQWARMAYIGGPSAGARAEVKDPIWGAGDVVVVRVRDGQDLLSLDLSRGRRG